MLGPLTHALVESVCPAPLCAAVTELLSQRCAPTLPGVGQTPEWLTLIDRVQLATLHGSAWDLTRIAAAVDLANTDWLDVIVGAGFGHSLGAHIEWQAHALRSGDLS
jgi:hypothetical protein